MEGHSRNAKSTIFLNNLREFWKSPRGAVLRIEFLAGVAITLAFLLAAFGSSRRLSKCWIVQKGFFAAHALSLSLGTYSIGLMQTSPVKSEMFPIWAVCLFALFGSIDPVTSYNGLDYKGPLSKIVFGICLQCGYVIVMSNSNIFRNTGNTAIIMLAGITFIKSFHRSLALVQQSRMRKMVEDLQGYGDAASLINYHFKNMTVDFSDIGRRYRSSKKGLRRNNPSKKSGRTTLICIANVRDGLNYHTKEPWYQSCFDACVAFALSHKLQQHLLGLGSRPWWADRACVRDIDYKWAMKVIEIELAFLYDIFFTGYPFLQYYQAKTASLWTLASIAGICFVGVATVAPGSHRTDFGPDGGCTSIVDTTVLDFVFTLIILVSIVLLQLMQLIQGWTSNWARCAIAWAHGVKGWERKEFFRKWPFWWPWWMRLKASVATSTTWFDKYLWQEKMGQFSMLPRGRLTGKKKGKGTRRRRKLCEYIVCQLYLLIKMLGFDYVWKVLWDLLGSDTQKRSSVRLDDDVKESIILFIGQIKNDILDNGNWLHLLPDEHTLIRLYLPYYFHHSPVRYTWNMRGHDYRSYARCVMVWHTATWYCEQVEQEREEKEQKQEALTKVDEHISIGGETAAGERERNQSSRARDRHVVTVLSKYCIYLVVSAPELIPGLVTETKFANDCFAKTVMALEGKFDFEEDDIDPNDHTYYKGMDIAKHLLERPSPDVAEFLGVPPPHRLTAVKVLFWNKAEKKTTFFDDVDRRVYVSYDSYYIALFVYDNKLRAEKTAPSNLHNPIPVKKQPNQSSEDGQAMEEIAEEIPPPPPPAP